MSDIVYLRDVASLGTTKNLSSAASATAGGAGNNTQTVGHTVDRRIDGGIVGCAALAILWDATLASGKTLSLSYVIQHSADGTTWVDYASGTSVVATGNEAATAQYGAYEIGVDLHATARFVRLNTTPVLSATAADTASTRSTGFFAGFDRLPQ